MLIFDTFDYAKKLQRAGLTEEQASVHVEALRTLVEHDLATKQDIANVQRDIAELRKETQQSIESLRKETQQSIESLRKETRQGIESLRKETDVKLAELKFRWSRKSRQPKPRRSSGSLGCWWLKERLLRH